MQNEKIEELHYRTIENGFYEVYATTDMDKIAIEGNVCGGILKQLIEQTKKDKGKIIRFKGKEPLVDNERLQKWRELQQENKEMRKQLNAVKTFVKRQFDLKNND